MARPCVARRSSKTDERENCNNVLGPQRGAFAPGHHGYPRASRLTSGQTLEGHVGIQSLGCVGQTVRPSLHSISQTSSAEGHQPLGVRSAAGLQYIGRGRDTIVRSGYGHPSPPRRRHLSACSDLRNETRVARACCAASQYARPSLGARAAFPRRRVVRRCGLIQRALPIPAPRAWYRIPDN